MILLISDQPLKLTLAIFTTSTRKLQRQLRTNYSLKQHTVVRTVSSTVGIRSIIRLKPRFHFQICIVMGKTGFLVKYFMEEEYEILLM